MPDLDPTRRRAALRRASTLSPEQAAAIVQGLDAQPAAAEPGAPTEPPADEQPDEQERRRPRPLWIDV